MDVWRYVRMKYGEQSVVATSQMRQPALFALLLDLVLRVSIYGGRGREREGEGGRERERKGGREGRGREGRDAAVSQYLVELLY